MSELCCGGGLKKRLGAVALLRSVSVLFSVGKGGSRQRGSARLNMKLNEGKGAANMTEYFRKQTHFSRQEVDSLCALFYKLVKSQGEEFDMKPSPQQEAIARATSAAPNSQRSDLHSVGVQGLERAVFRDLLYNTFGVLADDEVLLDRIFCCFDTMNDGVVGLLEWILGLSVFLKGNLRERAIFTFSVYDLNNDGYIVKDEMLHLLRNSLVKQPQDEDPDEGVKDLVEIVMKKLDLDGDGKVSLDDFLGSVSGESLFLEAFGHCLPTEAATTAFLMTLAP